MAALNFPLSPNDGDVYGNYVYDATEGVWNANPLQLASRFITSATQPTSPSNGDGWLDTNTGKTYVYYNDGSSAQWIESGNPVIGFVDPYDQTTTSTGHFALPKGTSAQRPVAPENGDIRFNTEFNQPEWYSNATSSWVLFKDGPTFDVEYLVIAGGGSGGGGTTNFWGAAGGGAGGYRSSVSGEISGGGAPAEAPISLTTTGYIVEVGAGGTAALAATGTSGSDSSFASIVSLGGGAGRGHSTGNGLSGGSGGGAMGSTGLGGSGEVNQGFDGGSGLGGNDDGAGGGGAGGIGGNPTTVDGGDGGIGVSSSITGSSIARAGGGGGGSSTTGGTGVAGGGQGGYDGSAGTRAGTPGQAGTGGGGGGSRSDASQSNGNNGGSGIVIIKYPSLYTATSSVGLTSTTNVSGDYKVTTFTAGTGSVTFS